MNLHDPTLYKVALTQIPSVGAVIARNLISYCGGIEAVFRAPKSQLLKIPGVGEKIANSIVSSKALQAAEIELKILEERGIRPVFYLDAEYPTRLKPYPESPILLFSKGNCELNAARILAIVGTRKPSEYGRMRCEKFVEDLRSCGVTIVSGLAYGIDITAHKTALQAGLPTVGVLGSGLGNIYPAVHRKIMERMLEHGGILTEFSYHTKPDRENFPARNRVVAAMADAVLVVESAEKGGSMITAAFANAFHKDVFALPGRVGEPASAGCHHLIKTHQAQLVESGEDIARFMNWDEEANNMRSQLPLFNDLSEGESLIVELLRERSVEDVDALAFAAKMKISEISTVLLSLEFKGVLKPLPGKRYTLA